MLQFSVNKSASIYTLTASNLILNESERERENKRKKALKKGKYSNTTY